MSPAAFRFCRSFAFALTLSPAAQAVERQAQELALRLGEVVGQDAGDFRHALGAEHLQPHVAGDALEAVADGANQEREAQAEGVEGVAELGLRVGVHAVAVASGLLHLGDGQQDDVRAGSPRFG